jgi:hypothetical protein
MLESYITFFDYSQLLKWGNNDEKFAWKHMHFCPAAEHNSLNIYPRENPTETVNKNKHTFYVQFSYNFRDNETKGQWHLRVVMLCAISKPVFLTPYIFVWI